MKEQENLLKSNLDFEIFHPVRDILNKPITNDASHIERLRYPDQPIKILEQLLYQLHIV